MRQLLLINKKGQVLDLLNKERFILKKADALHGIDTDIQTIESPYVDGVEVEDVKALPRGINLVFKLRGNIKQSIEYFTSFVKSKQIVTLREIESDKDIVIKGIATIPPYDRMVQSCEIALTIYCGDPYWQDLNYVIDSISQYINLLNFPTNGQYFTQEGRPFGVIDTSMEKSFVNESDDNVGMLIEILALGEVKDPRVGCSSGDQNGWYMQLNLTLKANDLLKIHTVRKQKYITINDLETYNDQPILNFLEFRGNDWLQLEQGANTFNVTELSGDERKPAENVYFSINYKGKYE